MSKLKLVNGNYKPDQLECVQCQWFRIFIFFAKISLKPGIFQKRFIFSLKKWIKKGHFGYSVVGIFSTNLMTCILNMKRSENSFWLWDWRCVSSHAGQTFGYDFKKTSLVSILDMSIHIFIYLSFFFREIHFCCSRPKKQSRKTRKKSFRWRLFVVLILFFKKN